MFGSCDNGTDDPEPSPALTDFITLTRENGINGQWIPETSFEINERINVGVKGYYEDGDGITLFLS
jgi:hypothetical protein